MDFGSILIGLLVLGFWISLAMFVLSIAAWLVVGAIASVVMAVVWIGEKIVEAIKGGKK